MYDSIIVRETFECNSHEKIYVKSEYNDQLKVIGDKKHLKFSFTIQNFFTSVFLPQGYPLSVSSDYLQYQLWDSLQAFASSIGNTMATHAVLKGVGVGDATATPIAATITWLLKDGTSMIGRILFAYIKGSKLDSECKKWRLFADIINDTAMFIDLISPYFNDIFIVMQCISGLLKSLVGVAGGSTRAALTQHQSRRNNLADVSAKDGSQETLVNLTALIVSLIIVPIIATNVSFVWTLFVMLTFLHIYCNYRAIKAVSMESFNYSRFSIMIEHYLASNGEVLSVREVNDRENVWFFLSDNISPIPMGVSLQNHVSNYSDMIQLMKIYNDKYILTFNNSKRPQINISLSYNADEQTQIEAVFQAILINYARRNLKSHDRRVQQIIDAFGNGFVSDNFELLKLSRKHTLVMVPEMMKKATIEGWNFNQLIFATDEWRYKSDNFSMDLTDTI